MKQDGCGGCAHRYMKHGETMCRVEPHDYKTDEQRAVAAWLSEPGRRSFTDAGCPSFKVVPHD